MAPAFSRTFAEVPVEVTPYCFVDCDNTYFDIPSHIQLLNYRYVYAAIDRASRACA